MTEDGKTYSAKQVATRIGTDAKQLRKFFRDANSGYSAVGQGGRYDFPETDIPTIKTAFDAWNATKTRRNRTPSSQPKPTSASGLIPPQRRDSPAAPKIRRSKDNKEGLHYNPLDDDTLQDRMQGIAARVQRHGLTMKQGRFVPLPDKPEGLTIMTNAEVAAHEKWQQEQNEADKALLAQPQILDFSEVDSDIQDVSASELAVRNGSSTELDELELSDDEGSGEGPSDAELKNLELFDEEDPIWDEDE